MKYVGGADAYWTLVNDMPEQLYEDVITAMQAEGDAADILRQQSGK